MPVFVAIGAIISVVMGGISLYEKIEEIRERRRKKKDEKKNNDV